MSLYLCMYVSKLKSNPKKISTKLYFLSFRIHNPLCRRANHKCSSSFTNVNIRAFTTAPKTKYKHTHTRTQTLNIALYCGWYRYCSRCWCYCYYNLLMVLFVLLLFFRNSVWAILSKCRAGYGRQQRTDTRCRGARQWTRLAKTHTQLAFGKFS